MTLIVGLGHKSRQGKDVAASAMQAGRGKQFYVKRYSFAEPLKLEVYNALLNPADPFWAFLEKHTAGSLFYLSVAIPKPTNPFLLDGGKLLWIESHKDALRRILQIYGGDYRRDQDRFYWIHRLSDRIDSDKPDIALVPDMRYLNEAYFVKSTGGFTVNVVRQGYVNEGAVGHASESELDGYEYDYVLTAEEGAVDTLKVEAVELLDMILSLVTPPNLTTEDFVEAAFV